MKLFINDKNVKEVLALLKSARRVVSDSEVSHGGDYMPEILTLSDFIDQIQFNEINKVDRYEYLD